MKKYIILLICFIFNIHPSFSMDDNNKQWNSITNINFSIDDNNKQSPIISQKSGEMALITEYEIDTVSNNTTLYKIKNINLLNEDDISKENYVKVYVWRPSFNSSILSPIAARFGGSVGHVAMEIVEEGKTYKYLSLYPGDEETKKNIISVRGQKYVNSYEDDWNPKKKNAKRKADIIVNLYSLNINHIKKSMELRYTNKDKTATWSENRQWSLTNGTLLPSTLFSEGDFRQNCSSFVLEHLKAGRIEELFPERNSMVSSCKMLLTTAFSWTLTIGGAICGKYIGSFFSDNIICSGLSVFSGLTVGRFLGHINYEYNEKNIKRRDSLLSNFIVTPSQIEKLVNKAKSLEKRKFKKTENWN